MDSIARFVGFTILIVLGLGILALALLLLPITAILLFYWRHRWLVKVMQYKKAHTNKQENNKIIIEHEQL